MDHNLMNETPGLSRIRADAASLEAGRKVLTIKKGKTPGAADQVKILIVDDLKDNLLALEGLLRRADVEIFQARSGTEALEFMMNHEFALAIIDVQMPIMGGFELAILMRGANKTKNIPIIFVTATAKDQDFSFKGYESGAVDFLRKPLDSHAVKSKVNVFIELYRQKIVLKNTQAELEVAVQMRDEFMSIASHELKTPLTSLKLHSQLRSRTLLKEGNKSFTLENLNKMFETDQKQVDQITRLIDDMLDISRISSGKLSMSFAQFDLCDLIRDLVDRCSEQFVAAGCPVNLELCPSAVGSWDHFRIEQVVVNLFTNAMRYGSGKSVLVRISATKDQAQIVVCDQGQGIAPENQERIFQKFERAVSGTEINGLGLGLFIVRQIVESHNGSIRVESELGKGATFIVELPITDTGRITN